MRLELPGLVDDLHLHVRDGTALESVVNYSAMQARRATIMPNLIPPVTTTAAAIEYRARILAALEPSLRSRFEPLMTLYLTDDTHPDEITRARQSGVVRAVKLYPAGATTNSASGVTDIARVKPVLQRMQQEDMLLLIHGEVVDREVDIFEREAVFLERHLRRIVEWFPRLRIVLEHLTTRAGVEFVKNASDRVAATITPHHLLFNRNALFEGGLRPHRYCLPVLKTEDDRQSLLDAATSGSPKFFMGTDSAPHDRLRKEAACCAAGCFVAHAAVELYAQAFYSVGKIDKLADFCCTFGGRFYGLPEVKEEVAKWRIVLEKKQWTVQNLIPFGDNGDIEPFYAGKWLDWKANAVRVDTN